MNIDDKQFPPYNHYCLTGNKLLWGELDPFCRTPYQRGWFLAYVHRQYSPTALDTEIFAESGEFLRAMAEFRKGSEDAQAELIRLSGRTDRLGRRMDRFIMDNMNAFRC